MAVPANRLRPTTVHGWVDGTLSLGSLALLVTGLISVVRADYFPGVCGLVAGVFGFALVEVLSVLHQLYRRLAEVEASIQERVAEAEARVLARLTGPPGTAAERSTSPDTGRGATFPGV